MIIQSLDLQDHQSPTLFLGKALTNSGDFPFPMTAQFHQCGTVKLKTSTPQRLNQFENFYLPNIQIEKTFVLGLLLGNNTNMELIVK